MVSGAWPRFGSDLAKKILVLLAVLATVCGAWTKVSPEVVWEDAGTRFLHPRVVLMKFLEVHGLNMCTCSTSYNCLSFATCATTSAHLCKGMKKVLA